MPDKSYPEGVTAMDHVNHDMKMGRFPNQSSVETFLKERAVLAAQEGVAHLHSSQREHDDERSVSLAELSAKATPGPWRHVAGDDYYIESQSYPPKATHNPSVVDSGWWLAVGNRPDDFGEANSKFIVALVNAYRSGRLKEADPA
jgi:hypothetical protein